MKTEISERKWKAIYRLLDRVSPLDYDCGQLCGAACCSCGGDSEEEDGTDFDMGLYLYPGEDKIHDRNDGWCKWSVEQAEEYDFPESWQGDIYFIRCKTPPSCPREKRPLQCRTYPLTPHIGGNGRLYLIRNHGELPYSCPLVEKSMELNPDFIRATYTVWKPVAAPCIIPPGILTAVRQS